MPHIERMLWPWVKRLAIIFLVAFGAFAVCVLSWLFGFDWTGAKYFVPLTVLAFGATGVSLAALLIVGVGWSWSREPLPRSFSDLEN